MSGSDNSERTLLVDASVWITLTVVGALEHLYALDGDIVVPAAVSDEVSGEPARSALSNARTNETVHVVPIDQGVEDAAIQLGAEPGSDPGGDSELLALAMERDDSIVISDDKPLRKTCKTLSIPVSGSIGVLLRAVERGDLDTEVAKDKLYAMDEVGARMSASLIKRAESLIEEANQS